VGINNRLTDAKVTEDTNEKKKGQELLAAALM
jgi:hypothetical protein